MSDVCRVVFVLALLVASPWAVIRASSAQEQAISQAGPPVEAIREAHALLAGLGYVPGSTGADTWSESLSRAYRAFLRDAGLPTSETLTPRGLRSLREVARSEGVAAGSGAPVGLAPESALDDLLNAVMAEDIDGARALLLRGVAVDGRDGRGWTPLMHAAHRGYVLLVDILLQSGASPDVQAPDGATALFMAVLNGHSEAIALLMRAGASVSVLGPRGLTPADAARLLYGNDQGQRLIPDDATIHALLAGMTWEDAVKAADLEAREKAEREKAEREFWGSVKDNADPSDLKAYLEAYPAGVYEEPARRRLQTLITKDDADYARARSVGTVEAYERYLSAYPAGRHVAEAREWAAMKPGRVFRDCEECPELVVVPAGAYMMGSPSNEAGRFDTKDTEEPMHRVTIGKAFAVGVYEVTVGEFGRFVEETGHSMGDVCWTADGDGGWRNPGFGQTERHPVVCVNWHDTRAYVDWLSKKTGQEYRLLSESEWEYAARGGTTTPFHYGATISTEQANYDGNYTYGSGLKGVYRRKTVQVGSFPPNGFGLHDVHGNVREWVDDCRHDSYRGAPADGSAWSNGGNCGWRVLRGGGWNFKPRDLRSAARDGNPSRNRLDNFGFRIARTLNP